MKTLLASTCRLLVTLSLATLVGCMVGPDYSRPQTAADTDSGYFHTGAHNPDINDLEAINNWWQRFADPATLLLVRRALENNYDLKAAAARVLQAQAAFKENAGRRWPQVSYNLGRDRSKRSLNFGGFAGRGRFSVMTTTWSQDISVSYILDLFGKLRRAQRAAWADMLAAQATEQALTNAIIASVIKARIDIATIQRRLAIERANIESRQSTLEIVEQRYGQGLVGPVDVRLARENLASAKAVEPVIELSLITAHHALDVLLGRRPGSSDLLPETLSDLPHLDPVPIGVPAALLDRRPDVMAAELGLRAANERIGVSIAQLYPDLTLTANVGRSADRWRDIWKDETEIYSAIFRLAQPIFRGGQLRAQVDAAKARYAEAAAVYARTVLTALKEVEDVLVTEQMLQRQLEHVEVRLNEASAAENLSRERYQRGVERILIVLESARRRRIAENELAVLKGQIWTTRVNIFLALGGDWTSEPQNEEHGGYAYD
ncbi:MAG: efflux transporter outer membrane subunit [Planctomycetota bacterium]